MKQVTEKVNLDDKVHARSFVGGPGGLPKSNSCHAILEISCVDLVLVGIIE